MVIEVESIFENRNTHPAHAQTFIVQSFRAHKVNEGRYYRMRHFYRESMTRRISSQSTTSGSSNITDMRPAQLPWAITAPQKRVLYPLVAAENFAWW